MKKRIFWMHTLSASLLSVPNLVYMGCNVQILKEANAIALTMTAMLVLSIVGLGMLTHIHINTGVWVTLIGVFILALSNISHVAGIALIIEGSAIAVDSTVLKPSILKLKTEELKKNGESVTYTREIK